MSQMIRVTLPDGSAREVVRGTTPAEIAADIGPGLAKAALAAKIDGELRDIMRPLEEDTNLSLVTSRDEADALELVRHDYAHVLAEAVQNLFPGTQRSEEHTSELQSLKRISYAVFCLKTKNT